MVHDPPACPDHGAPMAPRVGRHGAFLACPGYPDNCDWTWNGNPKAGPSNQAMRGARKRAHAAFDVFWKVAMASRRMTKRQAKGCAYKWLAHALILSPEDCHIELFDEARCQQVVELCMATDADTIYDRQPERHAPHEPAAADQRWLGLRPIIEKLIHCTGADALETMLWRCGDTDRELYVDAVADLVQLAERESP